MAYNPSPKVRKAEEVAEEFGFDKVIIVGIVESEDRFETISYGKNRRECNFAKRLAGKIYKCVYNYYEKLIIDS